MHNEINLCVKTGIHIVVATYIFGRIDVFVGLVLEQIFANIGCLLNER
jgi:hypothetical protein